MLIFHLTKVGTTTQTEKIIIIISPWSRTKAGAAVKKGLQVAQTLKVINLATIRVKKIG